MTASHQDPEILKKIEYFLHNKAYSYDKTKVESHIEKLLD